MRPPRACLSSRPCGVFSPSTHVLLQTCSTSEFVVSNRNFFRKFHSLFFTSLQQLNLTEVKVDKVQVSGAGNTTFAVCLDQDEKKVLQSVTRSAHRQTAQTRTCHAAPRSLSTRTRLCLPAGATSPCATSLTAPPTGGAGGPRPPPKRSLSTRRSAPCSACPSSRSGGLLPEVPDRGLGRLTVTSVTQALSDSILCYISNLFKTKK